MNKQDFIDYRTFYDISGKSDFILPSEIEKIINAEYSKEVLEHFLATLPPKEDLEWYKDNGYIFIPGPPEIFSMEKIVSIQPDLFCFDSEQVKERCFEYLQETKWIIIKKNVLTHDVYRGISTIYEIIEKKDNINHMEPNPVDLAWAMLIYKMSRGKCLLKKCHIPSSASVGWSTPLTREFPIMFNWDKSEEKINIYKLNAMSIYVDGITVIYSEPLIPLYEDIKDVNF